jgi:SpoIID/LytB domain protein
MRPPLQALLLCLLAVAFGLQPAAARPRPDRPAELRFTAPEGGTLLVHGTYPRVESGCVGPDEQPLLHARYRGTVEVNVASDGSIYLVGELPFEDYVKGIAEVPRDWPMAALRAQAVAARTYALANLDPGGEYDLCATTECQVYLGAGWETGPWGERWARAVDDTAGMALLHGGEPATTFYFSTSNGKTYDNEDVFGGEPLPYLRGVPERDDGASPVSRWRVPVPLADLARFLAADGRWGGGPIREVAADGPVIRIRGPGGRTATDREGLRDALNDVAGCLDPATYPSREPDGDRLPQTVPSSWFEVRQEGRNMVIEGRGWGHGVGMVQWGAYGKARRGLDHADILAAYYGGLRPREADVRPTIRVLAAEGLTSVTISGEANVAGARSVPPGPWSVTGGRFLHLRRGDPPPGVLRASSLQMPSRLRRGRPVRAALEVSADSLVRLVIETLGGEPVRTAWRPFTLGTVRLPVPGLAPGRYRVRAEATDGVDTVRTEPTEVRVAGAVRTSPSPSPPPSPSPSITAAPRADAPRARSASRTAPLVAAGALALLAALLTLGRWRRFHRRP